MRKLPRPGSLCLAAAILLTAGCGESGPDPSAPLTPAAQADQRSRSVPIPPVPPARRKAEVARLGEKLFADPIVSRSRTVSCQTCHDPARGGADGQRVPGTAELIPSFYNTPTVFNAALNFRFPWDGSRDSLRAQLLEHVPSERIMNAPWGDLAAKLRDSPGYVDAFNAAFPNVGITEETVLDALTASVEALVTPNARFDRWVNGDASALNETERRGFALFQDIGCIRCHQGVNAGGNMYASFEGYIRSKPQILVADHGRFNHTRNEEHRFQFRVAGLRNAALTAPYFHDGGIESLEEAVELMARHQLGRTLTPDQTGDIVAFLRTLTGEHDAKRLDPES